MLRQGVISEREPDTRPTSARASMRSSLAGAVLRRSQVLLIAILFAGALLVRLDGISGPSVQSRELQNALLARQYYLGDGEGLPAWKQRVLRELHQLVRPIEPPVLDILAGSTFRLVGAERLWIPRLWSTLLWLLGGFFLYRVATRVTRSEGAFFTLALYLFWPYPAFISRLYQPDALMIGLLLGGVLSIIRYWEHPSRSRLAAAVIASAAAVVVKPGIAFVFLLGLFVAIAVWRRALAETILGGRLPLFVTLTLIPTGLYYIYSVHANYFLAGQGDGWIDPTKWWTAWFWDGWWQTVSIMLVFPQHQSYLAVVPLALGLAGILVSRGIARAVLLGLFAAYVVFALTLTVPIASHPYYSLPLVPTLSLSIGVLIGFVVAALEHRAPAARAAILALGTVAILVAVYKAHAVLTPQPPLRQIADYRRIGEVTGHTTRAIYVDIRLRSPITYWAWIDGRYWYPPTPAQDLPASSNPFPGRIDAAKAEFLIVVDMDELETEKRLRAFTRDLPVVERTDRYAIFDLRGGRAVAAIRQSRLAGAR
jgi:4-amino-4-deoxy-L-arabinose transferase-like glycosyltransferase